MKASDNPFPKVILNEAATDGSDFSNPAADYRVLFLGEDGELHLKDSSGTVTDVAGAGGDVATDAIWDAAGDLAVGSGANTATRLAKGSDGEVLTMVAGAVDWTTPAASRAAVQVARVETSESTSSQTFTDLSTSGPAVTVTVPASGKLRICYSAAMSGGSGQGGYMDFALSGSNTRSASSSTALTGWDIPSVLGGRTSMTTVLSSLSTGSTTITAKYRNVGGGTTSFSLREISAEPVD